MMWQLSQKAGCMVYSPMAAMPMSAKKTKARKAPQRVTPQRMRFPGRRLMPNQRCHRGRWTATAGSPGFPVLGGSLVAMSALTYYIYSSNQPERRHDNQDHDGGSDDHGEDSQGDGKAAIPGWGRLD